MEIPVILNLLGDHVKKSGQILVFHLLAFSVEIKPDKSEIIFPNTHVHTLEIVSHPLLRAFLVDKVQDCTIFVVFLDIIVIFASNLGI